MVSRFWELASVSGVWFLVSCVPVRGFWFTGFLLLVSGVWLLIPVSGFLFLVTRIPVSGFWFLAFCFGFSAPVSQSTASMSLVSSFWFLDSGFWCHVLVSGQWYSGFLDSGFCFWALASGFWFHDSYSGLSFLVSGVGILCSRFLVSWVSVSCFWYPGL